VNGSIKAVIFDLGRVLIDFDHWIAAKKLAVLTNKNPQELYDLFFDSRLVQSFEEGKISPQDFFQKIKEMLGLKIGFEEFVPLWSEIFFLTEENQKVYRLAKQLSSRYTVALLSNVNTLHFEYIKKSFPVFDAFHHIFASCELGFIKPHPLIYQKVLDILEIKPAETFYVDDRAELVAEAKKLGIRGFVFKGIEQLRKDLEYCGVDCS
jgi:putative hydrolase of the HAD superfamily